MHRNNDAAIQEKIKNLQLETKVKRDTAPAGSEEKRYYRAISKELDRMLRITRKYVC